MPSATTTIILIDNWNRYKSNYHIAKTSPRKHKTLLEQIELSLISWCVD